MTYYLRSFTTLAARIIALGVVALFRMFNEWYFRHPNIIEAQHKRGFNQLNETRQLTIYRIVSGILTKINDTPGSENC